ncbi:prepilin-type N-terminal cleavage/methylation domain-containing protein [Desulfuromonas acetoxidans]|uniref:Type IV pilus modification protein PilV n=1 Tax=Desulfuromonas acetoxidans (strain DSM 684 / 11070) TaxID=281689 RepID=Q1JW96_DESA6|nr:prepilin-type N-terminal cleavage/methylation domain-containing protein [Desulfuromonas acetoxidans]EAT14525.1 conserved hypothetical protein [Desulfuromonas acetoxidans DSM 684]MBF0645258.1 prepilin-type N-terminal cleavage/methylation domain-containing protein [Desulfuromonas acetoxidans]NVD25564.1 prepilin-type N-terminal cleavage/methylation domain-containing protein [Desulfuromonas acetoxidans]NVE17626.1 prepilin-type N-terminal cleavage/methylation domain-containing protein [Desulfurom
MPCKTTSNKEAGFSLIELLVALTVFAIGLLALAGMQITAIQGNSSAHSLTALTSLADGLIEELWSRNGDSDLLVVATGTVDWPTDFDAPGTAQEWTIDGAGDCTATYQITPNSPIAGVTSIEINVQSPGRSLSKTVLKRTY